MSLQPRRLPEVPAGTARAAVAAFPRGSSAIRIRGVRVRSLNRLELAGESVRAALEALAVAAPAWLATVISGSWAGGIREPDR